MEDIPLKQCKWSSLDLAVAFACHFVSLPINRIKLRRVTTASYLPEFKIGSQQNVNAQEGAEVAGEAVEMPELRRGIVNISSC